MLDCHCGDCHDHGCDNGDERDPGHPGDVAEAAGERAEERDEEADDTVDDGAGTVGGDGVEHDCEGEDVGGHDEEEEDKLGNAEKFAAEGAKEDHACVGHVVDLGVAGFELTDYVAGVGG